jgi:flagellar protein FlaF
LENPDDRPKALRENILSLCNFIFKRTVAILAEPDREKLLVLIDINREVAAGLQQSEAASAEQKSSGDQSKSSDQAKDTPPPSGNFTTSV